MKKAMMVAALASGVWLLAGNAAAKLPPLSDDARLKAEEAKAKSAWSDKVAAYKLCQSQDKVAAHYVKAKGAKPATAATPCQDPGPFVAPTASAASGATSATVIAAASAKTALPAKK